MTLKQAKRNMLNTGQFHVKSLHDTSRAKRKYHRVSRIIEQGLKEGREYATERLKEGPIASRSKTIREYKRLPQQEVKGWEVDKVKCIVKDLILSRNLTKLQYDTFVEEGVNAIMEVLEADHKAI